MVPGDFEEGEAMLRQRLAPYPNVLVDIDTQMDFLARNGRRPVNNLDVLENVEKVFHWGRRHRITFISSLDLHRSTDPRRDVPEHCMFGTPGAEKMPLTLLTRRILVETDDTINLPPDVLTRYRQVLFVKRGDDLTRNPKADRLLSEIQASNFILFGVGLEESIRILALELLARKRNVWVVQDACGYWDLQAADLAARQIAAKNGRILTTADLFAIKPDLRRIRRSLLARRRLRHHSESAARGVPAGK